MIECKELNWLRKHKHTKKVRSRQTGILILNFLPHSFSVSIVKIILKLSYITNSTKTLNGFICMGRKIKQIWCRKIFTDLLINRKIPKNQYTKKLTSQKLISEWINSLSKAPYKRHTDKWYRLHVHWDMSESFRTRPFWTQVV